MPSLVKIEVGRARDLPVMDSSLQGDASTDAFVEVRVCDDLKRTKTCRKSLNPVWDEEFRFEIIDDSSLQDEPVELKVLDQDLYSSELIGIVYIDLNPLIMRTIEDSDRNLQIKGWFPLFDTLKGVRGSLFVTIKLQFIGNDNPFQDSSAGVQFFASSCLSSQAFVIQDVIGFVVDLVVDDDPESSWQDYFRKSGQASKSSNDSRQKVLYGLSAEVRREVGKKVLDVGGNAVLGFDIKFDLEGASGLVVRAYGTACRILKTSDNETPSLMGMAGLLSASARDGLINDEGMGKINLYGRRGNFILVANIKDVLETTDSSFDELEGDAHTHRAPPMASLLRQLSGSSTGGTPGATGDTMYLMQSVDANNSTAMVTSLVPFGPQGELKTASSGVGRRWESSFLESVFVNPDSMGLSGMDSNALIQSEVTLLSVADFDTHVNVRLGGLVMARSVKFLGKLEATLTDQETREGWWEELRDEIRSHARSLYCTHIIGYSESCSIYGDVCVLTAEGTGAKVKHMAYPVLSGQRGRQREDSDSEGEDEVKASSSSTSRKEHSSKGGVGGGGGDKDSKEKDKDKDGNERQREDSDADDEGEGDRGKYRNNAFLKGQGKKPPRTCNLVHVPYKRNRAPFGFMRLVPCLNCKRKWVPETILSTTEPSKGMAVRKGCEPALLEARVCRSRRKGTGETDAVKISEVLPFVEYDLQRQLMLKMRVRGMNAAFGYRSRIKIGENMVVAVASCSVTYLEALPPPPPMQIMQPLRDTDSLEAQRQHKRLAELQAGLQELWAHFQKSTNNNNNNNNNSSSGAANQSRAAGEGGGSSSASNTSGKSAGLHEANADDSSSSSSASSSSSSSSSSSATGGSSSSSLESPSSSSSSESSDDNNNNNEGGLVPSSTDKKEREKDKGREKDRSRTSTAASRSTDRERPDRDRDLDDRREQRNDSNRKASRRARLRRMLMDERQPYVVEVDDETDADVIAVLEDWLAPNGVMMANLLDAHAFTHEQQQHHQHYHRHASRLLNDSATKLLGAGRQISVMRRGKLTGLGVGAHGGGSTRRKSSGSAENLSLGSQLSRLYVGAYMQMCYNLRAMQPCVVLGLRTHINVLDDDTVEVLLSGVCHRVCAVPSSLSIADRSVILDSNIDVSRAVAMAGEWGGGYRSRGHTLGATTGGGMHSPDASRTTSVADDNNSGESPLSPTADSIAAALGSSSSSTPSSPAPGSYHRRGRSLSINSQGSVDNDVSTYSPAAAAAARGSSSTRAASLIPVSAGSPGSPTGGASFLRHFFGGSGDSIKFGDNAGNSRFRHGGARDTGGEDDADVNNAALNSSRIGAEPLMDPLSVFISPLSFVPGTVLRKYLGPIHLHYVKDSEITRAASREEGATEQFFCVFLSEASAMARAQVKALGGNALLAYKVTIQEGGRATQSSNRGGSSALYNMITISGDAVFVDKDESYCDVWSKAVEERESIKRSMQEQKDNTVVENEL